MLTHPAMILLKIKNPLDGKSPDFTAFGTTFNSKVVALILGIWAVCILIAVYYLVVGLTAMGRARGNNPHALSESKHQAVAAAISLGALAALPAIVGGILYFAG